jgi:REP element-mobilizing transposase RayT
MAKQIKKVMQEIAESYDWEIITQGMEEDHYHNLICVQPRYSPSMVVEKLKSYSAKAIFKMFPYIKSRLWGGEFWADGYCITTVGRELNAEQVKNYIDRQDIGVKM